MSTTTSAVATDVARDPTDIYDIVVIRSPTRCASCHQRVRDETELGDEECHDGLGTGNRPTSVLERAGAGEIGHDAIAKDDHGAIYDYQAKTFCSHCGRRPTQTPADAVSLETMLDRVPALVEALRAEGLTVDVDGLFDSVRQLKTDQEYASRDADIWRAATAAAVE